MTRPQKRLVLALCLLLGIVAACAAALFAIGEDAFGAIGFVGAAVGVIGVVKLRRAFDTTSVG